MRLRRLPLALYIVLCSAAIAGAVGGCTYQPAVPEGLIECKSTGPACPTGFGCYPQDGAPESRWVCCRQPGCGIDAAVAAERRDASVSVDAPALVDAGDDGAATDAAHDSGADAF